MNESELQVGKSELQQREKGKVEIALGELVQDVKGIRDKPWLRGAIEAGLGNQGFSEGEIKSVLKGFFL